MFPYQIQQALKPEFSEDKHAHSDKVKNDKPPQEKHHSNWFHSYQIPAEAPQVVKESAEPRKRSKSVGDLPMYPPMDPHKKMEWKKLVPHPKDSSIPKYEPMNPEHPMEWKKLMPHPKASSIPKYEPMNPEHPMEWKKLMPHPHLPHPQNWFHCYQIPDEKPKVEPKS